MSRDKTETDVQSTPSSVSVAPLNNDTTRVGRPPTIAKKKAGRPKGDAAVLAEYKARMLNSPKSRKVLDKLFEIALDDDNKDQVVCIKIITDRLLPASAFAPEKTNTGLSSINISMQTDTGVINISHPNEPVPEEEDFIDGTFEEQE